MIFPICFEDVQFRSKSVFVQTSQLERCFPLFPFFYFDANPFLCKPSQPERKRESHHVRLLAQRLCENTVLSFLGISRTSMQIRFCEAVSTRTQFCTFVTVRQFRFLAQRLGENAVLNFLGIFWTSMKIRFCANRLNQNAILHFCYR